MAAEYVVQFTLLTGIISNDNRRVKGSRRHPERVFLKYYPIRPYWEAGLIKFMWLSGNLQLNTSDSYLTTKITKAG